MTCSLERRLAFLVALVLIAGPGAAVAQVEEGTPGLVAEEVAVPEVAVPESALQGSQCTRTVKAYVVALDQVLYMNRLGANMPGGMIFALAGDVFPTGADQG